MISEIAKRIKSFSVTEDKIYHLIELNDQWRKDGRDSDGYYDIVDYLCDLTEKERHELMCLMDLGRNLKHMGFSRDVAETFIDYVDKDHFSHIRGRSGAEYLAGKVPLGDWLRLVMKLIKETDDFYRVSMVRWYSDECVTKDFNDHESAWAAYRELMTPETAKEYCFIRLAGHSLTGRAETVMAYCNFG